MASHTVYQINRRRFLHAVGTPEGIPRWRVINRDFRWREKADAITATGGSDLQLQKTCSLKRLALGKDRLVPALST